jgi:peptidoglycan hydrolase-like protein with peptidoglycan-binding domain
LTEVITDPTTGKVTRRTDFDSLTPQELAEYKAQLDKTNSLDSSDYELLTDEQGEALEDESIESARANDPRWESPEQKERALRAARRARFLMSNKPSNVPPIPKTPANPTIEQGKVELKSTDESDDSAPKAYVSPPTPINLDLARREAPRVATHIRNKGFNYSRQTLRDFQKHAGLTIDGIYGPLSASALRYFGVSNPPKALFKAASGAVTIYAPAT